MINRTTICTIAGMLLICLSLTAQTQNSSSNTITIKTLQKESLPYLSYLSDKCGDLYTKDEMTKEYGWQCGMLCLTYILRDSNIKVKYASLCAQFNNSPKKGISIYEIRQLAKNNSLHSRSIKGDISSLKNSSFPCIIHCKSQSTEQSSGHYMLVLAEKPEGFWVYDPMRLLSLQKYVVMKPKEVKEIWNGIIIEFSTTPFIGER
jgi:ABC-type bacteriocin/lantibiotic exporter with double-glycine peptidase domain